MTLEIDQEAMNKMEDLVTEVTQAIAALNISVGQEELEAFFHVNDETMKYLQLNFLKMLKNFWKL